MMKVARRERPKFPLSVRPDVAILISQCWQHDPDLRPDALAIIASLEAAKGTRFFIIIITFCLTFFFR
jgi:hypothetical protein